MDCDEIETESTKNMKEKTADEMFDELGYMQSYGAINSKNIVFYNKEKEIWFFEEYDIDDQTKDFKVIESNKRITMQELKAINKKCEDLRMAIKKQWKEIKGYEGKYIISNFGEVISLPRTKQNNSNKQYVEPREICRYINKRNGYVYVHLCNDGEERTIRLHRLVAETFIPNPNKLPQINHIDGNKENNRIDNLEWCTASENEKHAYKIGLANNNNQKIKVGQYSIKGELLRTFDSLSEASKITGVHIQKISLCINDKYKYRNKKEKYIWKKI